MMTCRCSISLIQWRLHPMAQDKETDEGRSVLDRLYSGSDTTSLRSSIVANFEEHGRSYHAYREGSYHKPNDDRENERLDIMHALLLTLRHGKLYEAPIVNPKRILDCGTGTGIWAIEMGEAFPSASILGTDLSAIQPWYVPPNVEFQIDDLNDEWTFKHQRDFIFCRYLVGSRLDYPKLYRQVEANLVPGGWCEALDFDLVYRSQDGTLTEDHRMHQWISLFGKTCIDRGVDPSPGVSLKKWMDDAGLINVAGKCYICPLGPWAKDPRLKQLGAYNLLQTLEGMEGFSLPIFTRYLGWTAEEVQILLAEVRQELRDPRIHAYLNIYAAWGQKRGEPAGHQDPVQDLPMKTRPQPRPEDDAPVADANKTVLQWQQQQQAQAQSPSEAIAPSVDPTESQVGEAPSSATSPAPISAPAPASSEPAILDPTPSEPPLIPSHPSLENPPLERSSPTGAADLIPRPPPPPPQVVEEQPHDDEPMDWEPEWTNGPTTDGPVANIPIPMMHQRTVETSVMDGSVVQIPVDAPKADGPVVVVVVVPVPAVHPGEPESVGESAAQAVGGAESRGLVDQGEPSVPEPVGGDLRADGEVALALELILREDL